MGDLQKKAKKDSKRICDLKQKCVLGLTRGFKKKKEESARQCGNERGKETDSAGQWK